MENPELRTWLRPCSSVGPTYLVHPRSPWNGVSSGRYIQSHRISPFFIGKSIISMALSTINYGNSPCYEWENCRLWAKSPFQWPLSIANCWISRGYRRPHVVFILELWYTDSWDPVAGASIYFLGRSPTTPMPKQGKVNVPF